MKKYVSENSLWKDNRCDEDDSHSKSTYEEKHERDDEIKTLNGQDRLSRWKSVQDLREAGTPEVDLKLMKFLGDKFHTKNIKNNKDNPQVYAEMEQDPEERKNLALKKLIKNLMLDEDLENIVLRRINLSLICSISGTSETEFGETILNSTPETSSMVQHFRENRRFIKNIVPETETLDSNEIKEKNNTEEISPTIIDTNKNNAFHSNVNNVGKIIPEARMTLIKSKWNAENETNEPFLTSNENIIGDSFNEDKKYLNPVSLIPICHGFISDSSIDSTDHSVINTTDEISPSNVDMNQSTPDLTDVTRQILDLPPEASTSRHQESSVKEQAMDLNQGNLDAEQPPSKFNTKSSNGALNQNASKLDSSESIILSSDLTMLSSDETIISSEVTHQSSDHHHTSFVSRNLDSITSAGHIAENLTESTRSLGFSETFHSIIHLEDTDSFQEETRGERILNTLVFTICLLVIFLVLGVFWATAFIKTEVFE